MFLLQLLSKSVTSEDAKAKQFSICSRCLLLRDAVLPVITEAGSPQINKAGLKAIRPSKIKKKIRVLYLSCDS